LTLSLEIGYSLLKSVAEIRVAQRKRGGFKKRHGSLFVFSFDFELFYYSLPY